MPTDWMGIAEVIMAIATMISVLGGLAINVVILVRQGEIGKTLELTHALVNGQSHALQQAISDKAFKAGGDAERAAAEDHK